MFEDRTDITVTEFLKRHAEEEQASFHMPGHKGKRFFDRLGYGKVMEDLVKGDITEVPGADNLFQPEGILRNLMNRYKAIYDSEESWILINGSSSGIIAAVLACIKSGNSIILGSNCHKSVISGLTLAGGRPVYVNPERVEGWDLAGKVTAESVGEALEENPDAKAVFVTSPNYYGICSPLKEIAEETHRRGAVLIVDQAHGAHLKMMGDYGLTPHMDGETLGADIVINSTHKTLASFTQTAVMNLCSDRISSQLIHEKLQLVESTSPSYMFMESMDINADVLEKQGRQLMERWLLDISYFLDKAEKIPGLKVLSCEGLDVTKINLDMTELGIQGGQLEEKLMEKGIYLELSTGNLAMAMTGIGNSHQDYDKLLQALEEISASAEKPPGKKTERADVYSLYEKHGESSVIPAEREKIFWKDAEGRICASAIVPYPPGIPLISPGQIMDRKSLEYAAALREKGQKVMGMDEEGFVLCGK